MLEISNIKEVINILTNKYLTKSLVTDILDLAINKAFTIRQGNEILTKVNIRKNFESSDFKGILQCNLYFNHKYMYIQYANIKLIFNETEYKKN